MGTGPAGERGPRVLVDIQAQLPRSEMIHPNGH